MDGNIAEDREIQFVMNQHDCLVDCDYPSQCYRVQHRAVVEGRVGRILDDIVGGRVKSKLGKLEETEGYGVGRLSEK